MSSKTVTKDDSSFNKKLYYSSFATLVFIAVSLPQVYKATGSGVNYATSKTVGVEFSGKTDAGCPTSEGKFLHTAVFVVLLYFIMRLVKRYSNSDNKLSNGVMWKYAFYSGLIFYLVSSTDAYNLTSSLGTTTDGCPNAKGIIAHAVAFLAVTVLVMYFPKDDC